MTNRADELLRRLFNEPFMAKTIAECRAYLNEKPHELPAEVPIDPKLGVGASPPHAAAEPASTEGEK